MEYEGGVSCSLTLNTCAVEGEGASHEASDSDDDDDESATEPVTSAECGPVMGEEATW